MNFDDYNTYRVSFIFATKDREENIDTTLDHLASFVTDKDELIIINGGTNCFREKILKYKFKNLKYIHEHDLNDVHAWNKGFLLSEGLIIRNICDDDYYDIDNHEVAFELMIKNNIDFLFCGGIKKNTINNTKSYINVPQGIDYGSSLKHIYLFSASGTGHIFKRSLFSKIGLWESPVQDLSFLAKSIAHNDVIVKFLSLNCFTHYFNEDSLSNKQLKIKNKFIYKTIYKYCGLFGFLYFYFRRFKFFSFLKKLPLLKTYNNNKTVISNFTKNLV